ncbi:MAG: response regulator [Gammaproteobacteria bacterium]|nr:response regulator [Gammaproteobacteria bacterium]
MKVLVVDDDEGNRKLLCDLLKLKNIDSVEAENGNRALALLSPEIGLCITDIRLPDIDGYEIAKRIREEYPKMPIIVCTASLTVAERIQMGNINLFDASLLKPVHVENFNKVMGEFLKDIKLA